MAATAGRRPPPAPRSAVPQIMAVGIVVAIVAAVTAIYLLRGQPPPADPEVQAEELSPFEGMPPEEAPSKKETEPEGSTSPFD